MSRKTQIPLTTFFFIVNFFLSSSPFSSSFVIKDNNLIESTCKSTPNYDLCVSTLKSDPKSGDADVAGLGLIVVNVVQAKSEVELNAIAQLSDPKLSECVTDYKIILNDLIPSVRQAVPGNPKFGVDGMNGVAHIADQCVNSLAGLSQPIPADNKLVGDLSRISVSIIEKLL